MPYKAKIVQSSIKAKKRKSYKVTNWTEYNNSLKKRGCLSLYLPYGDLKGQFINDQPYNLGISGRQSTYKTPYIELIYMFYRLFGWGMRQIIGYFEDLWRLKKLEIPVPSFGHLSDLFAAIPLKIKQFCDKLACCVLQGEKVTLIFDSTGLRFGKASHWYETKYDKPCDRKPWKKMHLAMDPDFNIHSLEITDCDTSDSEMMDSMINQEDFGTTEKIIADGAYYSIERSKKLYDKGIIPVIPPPSHSVVHGKESTKWHDKIVNYVKEKGTVYAFHKKYDYGKRALVEAQNSRIKRCIGDSLKTQRDSSQKNEGIVIANLINKWNSFGRCICMKAG